MKPSEVLRSKRDLILTTLKRYPVSNPRVFGSVVYGADTEKSDLDIMADFSIELQLSGIVQKLEDELSNLTGIKVQVVSSTRLRGEVKQEVEATAQDLTSFTPVDLCERFQRMKERRLLQCLYKMREYGKKVEDLITQINSRSSFLVGEIEQAALVKYLEEFGEFCSDARRTSQRFARKHREFPWEEIRTTRNLLAHNYDSLHPDTIWEVATTKLPVWQKQLGSLIEEVERGIADRDRENELEL